jgi:two-component system sensor histidine kinase VicK
LIALLVVFGVYSYRTIIDIQNEQLPARTNIRNISAALLGMQNYERNFLLHDVRNQDNSPFFEDGISLNIDRWQHEYESYITNLKELQEHSRINSPSGILPAIDRLNKLVFDYQIDFLTLTDRYKVRGFGQHGLEGDARAAAQSLESRVANDSGSLSLLLQARRYEKDFFLRSDSRALQNHAAAVNNLRSRLARDVEGLRLLQDYEEAFQRVVSIDGEIGLTPDTGIRGEIATSILKIHPIISKTQAEVLDRTNQSIRVFARLLAVLTALFVLLGIGFSLLITRLIQRSLAGLQEAAHDLAEGKMEKRIQTTGKDELGLLAGTFNDMANKLALSRATLEREKAKDEAILGGIGDAVFAIDTDGKIILFNPVASEITGFTDAEAIGQPYEKVLQFQYEGKNKKNDVFIREALSGKRTQMSNHTVVVRKDGEKVAVADSAAPLLDENGKVAGVVVVFRDVTQERAIDQAKSEFVSLASHQLRTPLSAINWYAEMLLAGDAGKINTEQKKYLKEIYDGNQRMVELVNALLNVSRLELGTFAIEPEPIDVKEIAESMLKEIAPMAKAKQMTVVAEYQPKLPKFSADPKLIRMIIQNLMTNAVKYTPDKGKVTLSISHEVHKKSKKAEFLITVSDNGYGIPKKQQEKIFTKLFRAENVQQKDTEGTGLGLYILKSIVDNSGGKIWFDSVEDKGTTFSVSYPTTGMIKREGSKSLD